MYVCMYACMCVCVSSPVESLGRRLLMLSSQLAVCAMLLALAATFYVAQTSSTTLHRDVYNIPDGVPDSHCAEYTYCFDCVQDTGCGYCSEVSAVGGAVYSDVCLSNDDDNDTPSNSTLCSGLNYEADSCPGSSITGWLIFMFLCLYLLAFAPGMGE